MTKTQYLVLLVTSIALVLVTSIDLVIGYQAQQANSQVLSDQYFVNNASQVDGPLQQLVIRIAQSSDKEPRLRDLLAKHGLKAKLNIDGQERQYP